MSTDRWEKLKKARDYRSFLKTYIELREMKMSDLARAAGYGRGFASDIISSRRRMTLRSCQSFEKGMKSLPAKGKKLFRMLVARDEPDLFPELSSQQITESIRNLRAQPWVAQRRQISEQSGFYRVFRSPDCSIVYAAAGSPERGALLVEMCQRTGFDEKRVLRALKLLSSCDLVVEDKASGRWVPSDLHLAAQTKEQRDEVLSLLFSHAAKTAQRRLSEPVLGEDDFFFTSHILVPKREVSRIKRELREMVLKLVDENIDPEGDEMVSLTTALYPSSER